MKTAWSILSGLCLTAAVSAQQLSTPEHSVDLYWLGDAIRMTSEEMRQANIATMQAPMARSLKTITINPADRQSVVNAYLNDFLPLLNVPINWQGGDVANCQPGRTSPEYAEATIDAVNYYRAMVSLPPVKHDSNLDLTAQQAALVMAANNNISHHPPTSWNCLNNFPSQSSGKSNLSLGDSGPEAIKGYIIDPGSNNTKVGHRRWILFPRANVFGTGSVGPVKINYSGYQFSGSYNALDVLSAPQTSRPSSPTIVAWPPKGFVPVQLLQEKQRNDPVRWSFSINSSSNADYSNASISMTETTDNGASVRTQIIDRNSYGYGDSSIVWETPDLSFKAGEPDRTFNITINDIKNASYSTYTYQTTVIDPQPTYGISGTLSGFDFKKESNGYYSKWVTITLVYGENQTVEKNLFENGTFTLDKRLQPGQKYKIEITQHNSSKKCSITNGESNNIQQNNDEVVIACGEQTTNTYSITVNKPANGTLFCDKSGTVNQGETVTCTATPNSAYQIDAWGGICQGKTGLSCQFSVTGASTVSVAFKPIPPEQYKITVNQPTHGSLSCDKVSAVKDETVKCTAKPDSGYEIDAWGGVCQGTAKTSNTCTFHVSDDSTVGVVFTSFIFHDNFESPAP